jgi:hypothetical protein
MSFTDGNRHNVMLEANLNEVHRAEAAVLTPEEQATFLASYLQAVCPSLQRLHGHDC